MSWKKKNLVFSIFFLAFFILASSSLALNITCDKDTYYELSRVEAFCNISNSGPVNISFTALYPSIIYGLDRIYDLENVTYNATVVTGYNYYEGTNHTGDVFLYNSTHLNYTENSTSNSTFIPLEYVWSYKNSTSHGAYDGWWTANFSEPILGNETRWKWDWVGLNYIYESLDNVKKYKIDNYNLNNSTQFKIVFNVPIGSSGKFNLTVVADNTSYSLDPWWNSSWQYRRNITINNTQNSNTLIDYQVAINITYDSDMQPDFDDLRFTYYNASDTETEIPYWIESKVNSSWAYVWVKVPSIPASSTKTIYLYYGNPSATSASNGDAVFLFFDDFSKDLSKWTVPSAKWTISNGVLDYIVSEASDETILTTTFTASDFIMEYKENHIVHTDVAGVFRASNTNNYYLFRDAGGDGNAWTFWKRVSGSWTQLATGSMTPPPANTWYKNKIVALGSSFSFYYNNNLLGSASDPTFSSGKVGIRSATASTGGHYQIDDFRVRKYTDPEPATSVGAEEIAVYISVTFNYTSVNFGTVTPKTLASAPNQNLGYYNVTVDTNRNYQVKAYGYNWSGPDAISISTLYFDTNSSCSDLSYLNSIQLSESSKIIDTYPSTTTTNYHGYWFDVPLVKIGDYNTTVVITYENV